MKSNIMFFCFFSMMMIAEDVAHTHIMQPREKTDISAREKRVKLNGKVFEYRKDENNITGEYHEIWKINGQKVSPEKYEEEYQSAKEKYKKEKREHKEYQKLEKQRRIQHINAVGSLRLLELAAADIESTIKKLDDKHLKPYYQFAQSSIESQKTLNNLQDEWLPQARKLVRSYSKDVHAINEQLALVDGVSEKLSDFYLTAVDCAILHEDNPKVLKKWLSLVA